jgi:Lsr2
MIIYSSLMMVRVALYIEGPADREAAVAQRVEVEITCDRVAPGHGGEVESLEMTLGGTEYQIDLCVKHRKPYNELLEMITVDGRRVTTRGRRQSAARKQPSQVSRNAEMRAWAKEQGIDVSARGRIADDLVQKYDAR